jgi:AraC-like DNA-binding protein
MSWLERIAPRPNVLWRGLWPARFVEPPRWLFDHELVVVSRGEFRLEVGGDTWDLHAGMFAIVPPLTRHASSVTRGPVHRSCVHFDWTDGPAPDRPICCYEPDRPVAKLAVRAPSFVPRGGVVGPVPEEGAVRALLETLFFRWQTGEAADRALCRATLLELLLLLLWPRPSGARKVQPASRLAYAAKDALDALSSSADGIQTALAGLGCSYAHACRVFQRHFGLTPGEYLTARRLERARLLLDNPRLSVAEVGYQAGFNDPGYFGKKFRARYGKTPGRFRVALEG